MLNMKKVVRIVLGLLLGVSSLSCYCQDARAVELLRESKSKFDALQDFSAEMVYSNLKEPIIARLPAR